MKKRMIKKKNVPKTGKKTRPRQKAPKKSPVRNNRNSLRSNKIKHIQDAFIFPAVYGKPRLTLMARDPWWIYAYWEIPAKTERETLALMSAQRAEDPKRALRVYRRNGDEVLSFFDIDIGHFAECWYVEVGVPGAQWSSEIGLRSADGRFYGMLTSNRVRTPRYGISEVVDPDWRLPEGNWRSLLEASGAFSDSQSSFDIATDPLHEKN